MERHVERLRRAELEPMRGLFRDGVRVLELGGDRGHQASIMASWGARVVSLDLADRPQRGQPFYPVGPYDGRHVPYPAGSFDIVFTSNVLEHVRELEAMMREIGRVLAPGGLAVHVVPSATWRLWTSVSHYGYVAAFVLGLRRRGHPSGGHGGVAAEVAARGWRTAVRRALLAGPHGEDSSAWAELLHYRRAHWARIFDRNGFAVVRVQGAGVFYTGYELLPGVPMAVRRGLARVLGSSCHVFVLRKGAPRRERAA